MRILIVDDEAPARARLARMIDDIDSCEVVGEAVDGVEALEYIQSLEPDIVLLDVRMPRMDGIEVAFHLAALDTPPAVIFTTAYDEYALQALDANAVAYLLKPLKIERLEAAIERASRPTRAQLDALQQPRAREHLSARVGERLELLRVSEVHSFIADQKYVAARHKGGFLLVYETLKDLEQEFSGRFMRIHRSALVAVDRVAHLETLDNGGGIIRLRDDPEPLEVSRRHLADVKRRLRGD